MPVTRDSCSAMLLTRPKNACPSPSSSHTNLTLGYLNFAGMESSAGPGPTLRHRSVELYGLPTGTICGQKCVIIMYIKFHLHSFAHEELAALDNALMA